jgi:class 3 adenylate cyclase
VACEQRRLAGDAPAGTPFTQQLAGSAGPIIAATDYVRAVPESVRAFVPEGRRYVTLGTDGFGRRVRGRYKFSSYSRNIDVGQSTEMLKKVRRGWQRHARGAAPASLGWMRQTPASLYNLLLFAALRDANHLLYSAASSGIVWAVSCALGGFGFAFEMLWPDSPRFERAGWALSMAVSHLLSVTFFAQVLEMRHGMPDLHKWLLRGCALFTTGILAALGTTFGGDLPGARRFVLAAAAVVGVAMSFIVLFALVRAAKARSRAVVFIVIAWLPLIIASTPFTLGMLTQTPSDNRFLIWASIFEMLMMSLLLADKFNQEKRAKSIAQTALVDHLQKSEQELESKVAQRTDELAKEQTRTKELLHNILPVDIAQEISSTGSARPARHEAATILFTDFSGFTMAVATMPADRMVAELNEIFAAFDDITDACGVEKIKTIGDAYMAVAGLPKPCADHAQRCVRAGWLMLAYLEERNINAAFKWQLRIGIHSGPVVAGVVGKRKYAFDIWGDAVNIASRMESSGEVGRVNVSAYTYDLIRGEFQCEYRGKVGAKGKGEVDMYFVAGGVT